MKVLPYIIIALLLLFLIFRPITKPNIIHTTIDTVLIDTVTITEYKVDTVVLTKYKTIRDTIIIKGDESIKTTEYDFARAKLTQSFKIKDGPDELLSQELQVQDSVEYITKYIDREIVKTSYEMMSGRFVSVSYVAGYNSSYYMANYGVVNRNGFIYSAGVGVDNNIKPVAGVSLGIIF